MQSRARLWTTLCALCALSAVGVPPQMAWAQDTPAGATIDVYRVGVGDVITVSVLGHPEYSMEPTRVRPDGMLTYLVGGNIVVAGKTVSEIGDEIKAQLLKAKRLTRASVTVNVVAREPRMISVLGVVRSSGKIELRDGWRVLDAIAASGGVPSDRYEFFDVVLFQKSQPYKIDLAKLYAGDTTQNRLLLPGDTITVTELDQSKTVIQVIGEVLRPGASVPMPRDGSIVTVLNVVGGVTPKAALSKAVIERNGKTLPIDLRNYAINGTVANSIKLEPGDKLIIPENKDFYRIVGAVARGGDNVYPDDRKITLLDALSSAGVQTQGSDLKKVRVTRKDTEGHDVSFEINVEKMLKQGDRSGDLPLIPGDLVYVPLSNGKRGLGATEILGLVTAIPGLYYFFKSLK